MSVMESSCTAAASLPAAASRSWADRLSDYRELAKPRIAAMALITVTVGFFMADPRGEIFVRLAHALLGIAMIAGACGALNQFFERKTDRRMPRTANRPLPSGRMAPAEALAFGVGLAILGTAYLAWFVNGPTAILSVATLLLYVLAYTPMKRMSSWCTIVGAVPGAMPPVLGWAAAGGGPTVVPVALFGILYIWQFPHLLAIAWLYRGQYADAGLHMLPGQFPRRGVTGLMSIAWAALLIPVSLLPWQGGMAGNGYAAAAIILGGGYLLCSIIFCWNESPQTARRLLWSSLLYLPTLLAILTFDFVRLS